mmetsp:Transcript_95762/g.309177  ORF Transcript_95762/g.309177 Transcript_95762/m.309177 type:complete len:212 (+) Transcript_95762:212-847(+)
MSSRVRPMRILRRPSVSSKTVMQPLSSESSRLKNVSRSSTTSWCGLLKVARTVAAWSLRQVRLPVWSSSTTRMRFSAASKASSLEKPMTLKVCLTSRWSTRPELLASQTAKRFQISNCSFCCRRLNFRTSSGTLEGVDLASAGSAAARRPSPARRTNTRKSLRRPSLPSWETLVMASAHFLPSMEFRTVRVCSSRGTTWKSITGHSAQVSR